MTSRKASAVLPGSDTLDREMLQQIQVLLMQFFGRSYEPLSSPIWMVLRCPACGRTGMAYVDGGFLHVAEDHTEAYETVATGLTWRQARSYFGTPVEEIFGIGPFFDWEDIGTAEEARCRKRRERFIAMADYLTGVTARKPCNGRHL